MINKLPANIDEMMQPGVLCKDGFLGADKRLVKDIIEEDLATIKKLGMSVDEISDRMTELTAKGSDLMEREVSVENRYSIKVRDDRGPAPDPFGGSPQRKGDTLLKDYKTGKAVVWNDLTIHMIREYGFFGGRGEKYRIEPDVLINILGLSK